MPARIHTHHLWSRFTLALTLVGLTLTCIQECSAQVVPVAEAFTDAILEEVEKNPLGFNGTKFYLSRDIVLDIEDQNIKISDRRLAKLVGSFMDGEDKRAEFNNDKYQRVDDPKVADFQIRGLRIYRGPSGQLFANADIRYQSGVTQQIQDQPIDFDDLKKSLTQSAKPFQLAPKAREDLDHKPLPDNAAQVNGGCFGVEVRHNDKPVQMTKAPEANIFEIHGLKNDDVFTLRLYNSYTNLDAIAYVRLDGEPHFKTGGEGIDKEFEGKYGEYVDAIPVVVRKNSETDVLGWQSNQSKAREFVLESLAEGVKASGDHNVVVRFHFAKDEKDRNKELPKLVARARGFKIGKGKEIKTNLDIVRMYTQPQPTEVVRIVFK